MTDNKKLLEPQWPDLGIKLSAKDITSKGLTLIVEHEGEEESWKMRKSGFTLEVLEDGKWKCLMKNSLGNYVTNKCE